MSSIIVLYFTPHFDSFTDPLLSPKFTEHFHACDTFILEWALPWYSCEPELESSFNELSRGERDWVKSRMLGRDLNPFDRKLQEVLRGRRKRIVLERSPVEYVNVSEGEVIALARFGRLNEAISLYAAQLKNFADSMVKKTGHCSRCSKK